MDRNRLTELNGEGKAPAGARAGGPIRNDENVPVAPQRGTDKIFPVPRNPTGFMRPDEFTPRTVDPSRTPGYLDASRTPGYIDPSKTPMHEAGSKTPSYGVGFGSRTPSRTPRYNYNTPSYPAQTPVHENTWEDREDAPAPEWDDMRTPRPEREEEPEREDFDDFAPPASNYGIPPTPGNYGEDADASNSFNPKTPGFQVIYSNDIAALQLLDPWFFIPRET